MLNLTEDRRGLLAFDHVAKAKYVDKRNEAQKIANVGLLHMADTQKPTGTTGKRRSTYASKSAPASGPMRLHVLSERRRISTGFLALDAIIGAGGLVPGQIVELYGKPATWKTTIALQMLASAQRGGRSVAYLGADGSFNLKYFIKLGGQPDRLILVEGSTAEEAFDTIYEIVRSSAAACVVIDSVPALLPKSEAEQEIGASPPGLQANLMSQALRKLIAVAARNDTTIMAVNNLYDESLGGKSFLSTPGGFALRNFAGLRIKLAVIAQLKESGQVVGETIRMHVTKNRFGPPGKSTDLDMRFGRGFDNDGGWSSIVSLPINFEENSIEDMGYDEDDFDE